MDEKYNEFVENRAMAGTLMAEFRLTKLGKALRDELRSRVRDRDRILRCRWRLFRDMLGIWYRFCHGVDYRAVEDDGFTT